MGIVNEYCELANQIKELESKKKTLRDQIIQENGEYWRKNSHFLPRRIVNIPKDFFEKTELDPQEFIASRYPAWYAESFTETEDSFNIVLRQSEYSADRDIEEDDNRIVQSVTHGTPDIDFETLKKEDSDMYENIIKKREIIELDDDKLEDYLADHPRGLGVLERHLVPKVPSIKITPRKAK